MMDLGMRCGGTKIPKRFIPLHWDIVVVRPSEGGFADTINKIKTCANQLLANMWWNMGLSGIAIRDMYA